MVPVRGAPVAAATSYFTVLLPVPLAPDRMVIQLESDTAVQVHMALDARTAIVPEPARRGEARRRLRQLHHAIGRRLRDIRALIVQLDHAAAAGGSLFAAATYSTLPSPCPLPVPLIVSHEAVEFAVHAHSRLVVTATAPRPPDAGTLSSGVGRLTEHRGTVDGAVDVDVEDPQPAPANASARASPALRFSMIPVDPGANA